MWWLPAMFCNAGSISLTLFSHEKWSTVTYVADAWKQWARERMGAREEDTWGERERLPGRPTKIVSRPQSNYLEAAMWSVKNFDRKQLTPHKQSVPPKGVVHFILGLNISVIKISWVIWLFSFKSSLTTGTINRKEQSQKWVSFKEGMKCIIKS